MRKKLYIMVVGAVLAVTPLQGQVGPGVLNIIEQDDNLTATYNGLNVPLILTGPVNAWTVQLPNTFSLVPGQGLFNVGEFEPGLMNTVNVGTSPQFLIWESDVPLVGGPYPLDVLIPLSGTTTFTGEGNPPSTAAQQFNLLLSERPSRRVPDVSSSFTLLSLGLAGLSLAGARLRKSKV